MRPPADLVRFCEDEFPRLVGALTLYCGSHEIGEELAQEVLMRVCRHWHRLRSFDNPGAWAHHVGINLANSYFRRRRAERRAETRLRSMVQPEPSLMGPSLEVEIRAALLRLRARHRAALVLRHYVGLSVAQTAEQLGCPEGSVKRLTHEAIRQLRHELGDREVPDGR